MSQLVALGGGVIPRIGSGIVLAGSGDQPCAHAAEEWLARFGGERTQLRPPIALARDVKQGTRQAQQLWAGISDF